MPKKLHQKPKVDTNLLHTKIHDKTRMTCRLLVYHHCFVVLFYSSPIRQPFEYNPGRSPIGRYCNVYHFD